MFTKRQIDATRIEFLHSHASSFDAALFVVMPCIFRQASLRKSPGSRKAPNKTNSQIMTLRRFQLTLEGVKPLLCGNPCTIDTLGKEAQAKKWYTDLGKKNAKYIFML
jgi:hypothetical protein